MPVQGFGVRFEATLANGEVASTTMRLADATGSAAFVLTDLEMADIANAGATVMATAGFRAIYAVDLILGPVSIAAFTVVPPVAGPPPYTGYIDEDSARVYDTVGTLAGTAGGQSSPPQVAVVQSIKAQGAGRRGTGRLYTFPPPEGVVGGNGQISDVVDRLSAWQTLEQAVLAEAQSIEPTARWVVVSPSYDEVNVVFTNSMNARVDTQRRRLQR